LSDTGSRSVEMGRGAATEGTQALLHKLRWQPWKLRLAQKIARQLLSEGAWQILADSLVLGWHDPRSRALAQRLLSQADAGPQAVPVQDNPPVLSMAWVSMVKNEADILFVNLLWHYQLGLRRFYMLDNVCTDETMATVQLFQQWHPDAEVCIHPDPEAGYFQARKMTFAAHQAMQRWPDLQWVLLIDADEFLCPARPLAEIVQTLSLQADAVLLPKSVYRARAWTTTSPTRRSGTASRSAACWARYLAKP
jgi:hypothetical protein